MNEKNEHRRPQSEHLRRHYIDDLYEFEVPKVFQVQYLGHCRSFRKGMEKRKRKKPMSPEIKEKMNRMAKWLKEHPEAAAELYTLSYEQ